VINNQKYFIIGKATPMGWLFCLLGNWIIGAFEDNVFELLLQDLAV
jgi:hypothetical protein